MASSIVAEVTYSSGAAIDTAAAAANPHRVAVLPCAILNRSHRRFATGATSGDHRAYARAAQRPGGCSQRLGH
jgi:hypothetical protein